VATLNAFPQRRLTTALQGRARSPRRVETAADKGALQAFLSNDGSDSSTGRQATGAA